MKPETAAFFRSRAMVLCVYYRHNVYRIPPPILAALEHMAREHGAIATHHDIGGVRIRAESSETPVPVPLLAQVRLLTLLDDTITMQVLDARGKTIDLQLLFPE